MAFNNLTKKYLLISLNIFSISATVKTYLGIASEEDNSLSYFGISLIYHQNEMLSLLISRSWLVRIEGINYFIPFLFCCQTEARLTINKYSKNSFI